MANTEFGFKYETACYAAKPHLIVLQNISPFHSITMEFYGSTGGIYRYFPRGRNEMKVHFQHRQHGDAQLIAIARSKDLASQAIISCKFEIQPASQAPVSSGFIGDDEEDDIEWEQKMWDIDRRFAFEQAPELAAAGKPPMAEPYHPDAPVTARVPTNAPDTFRSLDPAKIIQDRLENRLLSRFKKD